MFKFEVFNLYIVQCTVVHAKEERTTPSSMNL